VLAICRKEQEQEQQGQNSRDFKAEARPKQLDCYCSL
jgi:hypothetical protein